MRLEATDLQPGDSSLGRGAAAVSFWTAISRVTGFVRVMVVAGALGATHLANTYNSANTAPNLVFELMAAGVLTSVFVPTFVRYLVRGRADDTWGAVNALTSSAILALMGVALVVALLAPWLMDLLLIGVDPGVREEAVAAGTSLLRLFTPQIVLYGVGMIMTAALHAHRRFAMAAIAPIFNNLVVIAVYLTYAGMRGDSPPDIGSITSAQLWVLGLGTTLGVAAMTFCLLPALRGIGWHFRFRPDFRHPAVGEAARLGVWALSYAGGYQAGLIVVLILANRIEGGFAAYQWAFTFFYLPHALFGVPIFNVLFTAMSERVAEDRRDDVAQQLRAGLRMLGFLLLPMAAGIFVLSQPLTDLTLQYGVMSEEGASLVGRVLAGFAVGLPFYSAFLVLTRAFYALSDTRTPALINGFTVLVSSLSGLVLFLVLPSGWEVPGLALGHTVGAATGFVLSLRSLTRRVGPIIDRNAISWLLIYFGFATMSSLVVAALLVVLDTTPAALTVPVACALGGATYLVAVHLVRSSEAERLNSLVRSLIRKPRG